jgi:hypothetical protein
VQEVAPAIALLSYCRPKSRQFKHYLALMEMERRKEIYVQINGFARATVIPISFVI